MRLPFRMEKTNWSLRSFYLYVSYELFFPLTELIRSSHLCSGFDPSAIQSAQRSLHLSLRHSDCLTVHRRAAELLRAGSTEYFTQFDVAGELKAIAGSYCSWKQTRAPARSKYQEGLGEMKKSQYPLQKLVP